ncbi:MAG TPA: hypothetical protein VET65_09890 [Candidatus Limnocylindrales bacterium]|nr:hypothetical protein [Candidatus Limnocylindrales bacterium]
MTKQYLVGELSSLLACLLPVPDESLGNALRDLRREVEAGPVSSLPPLARQAVTLTDLICWVTLERGDVARFCRDVDTAVALREFALSADLLP